MKIHKRRYLNALKKAARINRYLRKGYHVFYQGQRIHQGFVLAHKDLLLELTNNCSVVFYINDAEYDNGYWTSIKKYNESFAENFEVFVPQARVHL